MRRKGIEREIAKKERVRKSKRVNLIGKRRKGKKYIKRRKIKKR